MRSSYLRSWYNSFIRLIPQFLRHLERIDVGGFSGPPSQLVAGLVKLAMMGSAKRNGELIADLAAEGPAWGKSQMMGVGGATAAEQARLAGDKPQVLFAAPSWQMPEGEGASIYFVS